MLFHLLAIYKLIARHAMRTEDAMDCYRQTSIFFFSLSNNSKADLCDNKRQQAKSPAIFKECEVVNNETIGFNAATHWYIMSRTAEQSDGE